MAPTKKTKPPKKVVIDLTDPENANWRDIERATGKPLPGPNLSFYLEPVNDKKK
jgi:hypothetical protein